MAFCTVDRVDPAHPRAADDCSPDVQGALDSPGLAQLPAAERRSLVEAIRRQANDVGFAEAMRAFVDSPALADLPRDVQSALVRQVVADPCEETARRATALVEDDAFRAMPRDLALSEIDELVTAQPPDARELSRGAGLEAPPRSRPMLLTMLADAGLEVAELAEASHALDAAGVTLGTFAGGTVLEAATVALLPGIAAFECAEGVHAAIEDGREWGRRIGHGAGFAEGIARHLAGAPSRDVPAAFADHVEATRAFRGGLAAADRVWDALPPSERAALLATGGGTLRDELSTLVSMHTIHGR